MAIIRDFRDGLTASGIGTATLYVYLRALVAAGLIRKSRQGSRRLKAHLGAREAATVLLALAAPYPTDAVKAVEGLADLRRGNLLGTSVGLLDTLAGMIDRRARELAIDPSAPAPRTDGWQITLAIDPAAAWMSWNDGETRERFRDPQAEIPSVRLADSRERGLRRETTISWALLEQAATLVADSLRQTGQLPTIDVPMPTAETENAAPARTALREDPPEAQATDRSGTNSSEPRSCAGASATLHELEPILCNEAITRV
jgi:hypothetical protein